VEEVLAYYTYGVEEEDFCWFRCYLNFKEEAINTKLSLVKTMTHESQADVGYSIWVLSGSAVISIG
jgi:hypothetical protein